MMSAGSVCRLHRLQAVKVWCVCQRQTCKPVAGFPCRLWATMPCWLFGRLAGLFCGSSSASLNAHADGAAMCPAWCQVLRLLASCRLALPVASIGGRLSMCGVCQRQTCKPVAGFPCRLWATMPCRLFGGLAGFPVALQVPASTLMLMGGNVSGIASSVEAACIMSAGSLHRWRCRL